MFSSKPIRFAAAGVAAVAVAIGGFAIGNSSSGNGASGTATAAQVAAPGHGPRAAQIPPGDRAPQTSGTLANGKVPTGWTAGSGTIVTGAAADKAKAAALAGGYAGTVNRVMKLSDGSYAVHMFATSGPHHVFVSKDFKVTGAA
jgi:hypothetical protein